MSAGKIDAALQQTAALVEQEPQNAMFWSLQGKLEMTARNFHEAAESLQKSISLQPDPETAYVLATAWINLHQTANAQCGIRRGDSTFSAAGEVKAKIAMPAVRLC
jgi:predicted Zn-dependent protease